MSVGESSVKPSRISPFDSDAERAYDDAEWGDESNSRLYLEENVKIYDGENHYIKVDFNYSGKANIYLEWDDDSDLDLYFFDRDGLELDHNTASKDKTNSSGNKFALIYGIDINEDSNYLVGIRAFDTDGSYCRYTLKVKLYDDRYDYNDMLDDIGVDDSIDRSYKFYEYGEDRDLLEYGDEGTDVAHLQRLLVKLNYLDEDEIDGIFGRDTRSAVRNFQEDWCIAIDGIVGPITRSVIEKALNWRRYNSHLKKSIAIKTAIEASGLAGFCGAKLPNTILEDSYKYGPYYIGPFKVTYKIGYNINPSSSMIKVTVNGGTVAGQINLYDRIRSTFDGTSIKSELRPLEDLVSRLETDENSEVYVSNNFPKIVSDGALLTFEGPSFTIGAKKVINVDLGGGCDINATIYEELILEPNPQNYDSSTNTSQISTAQSVAEIDSSTITNCAAASALVCMLAATAKVTVGLAKIWIGRLNGFIFIPRSNLEKIEEMRSDQEPIA